MTNIVNLNISELVISKEPVIVSTVLGSCVSVCLFSKLEVGGGIIHYALPELPKSTNDNPLRYGDYAIEKLIVSSSQHLGLKPFQFVAKLVGGANNIASEHPSQHVGDENVKIARKLLDKYGIEIIGEDVGGVYGRKVLFHLQTGRLQVAFVGPGFSRPSASKAASLPIKKAK